MDIYEEKFIIKLFDRMSKTYGTVNYFSSFEFTARWRKQCVQEINWDKKMEAGYDFMSGMGECWNMINHHCRQDHRLTGIDISPEMNDKARKKILNYQDLDIKLVSENILKNTIESESADYIISSFGLKTFTKQKPEILAKEIA